MFERIEKLQILLSALLLSFVLLLSALIIGSNLTKNDGIAVTGSAYKIVQSDSGSLWFSINCKALSKSEAYNLLTKQIPIVEAYLKDKKIKDIEYKTINGYYSYKQTANGYDTNVVDHYNLSQGVQVRSDDVQRIKDLAMDIPSLLNKGVDINVNPPQFYYSDLSSLKVDLLEDATKDAKQRAKAMLKATHDKVGNIKSVKMGVFQITPVDSTNVSDMGISDTSTIEKKVTAVANVVFSVK